MLTKTDAEVIDKLLSTIEELEVCGYSVEIRLVPRMVFPNPFELWVNGARNMVYSSHEEILVDLEVLLERPRLSPNWNDAPDWAMYWAIDSSGKSYWYENKPVYSIYSDVWAVTGGYCHPSEKYNAVLSDHSTRSLRNRPTK